MKLSQSLARAGRLTMSSWFCVPEQGMREFELLSRASCFLLPASGREEEFHVLGAGHVPFPFRFPRYYPPEQYQWLEHVEPHHTRSQLEVRNESDGHLLETFPLKNMVLHSDRDVVVGSISDERKFKKFYSEEFNDSDASLALMPSDQDCTNMAIHVAGCGVDNAGMPEEVTFVQRAEGVVAVAMGRHIFAATDVEIRMGICGGAVISEISLDGSERAPYVIGMLEGVVSSITAQATAAQDALRPLKGNAAVIPAPILGEFCQSLQEVRTA